MSLVDWNRELDAVVGVTFSTLAVPDDPRDDVDDNIAELKLADGRVVDVEWDDASQQYWVTLYRPGVADDEVLRRQGFAASEDVVAFVRDVAAVPADTASRG